VIKRLLIFVLLFSFASCGKENQDPVFNDFPLVGTWISRTGNPVFTISNLSNTSVKDDALDEKYYEYREGAQRLLRRSYQGITTTYQIIYIDPYELKVVGRNGIGLIEMLKAN
jgi:hypothetical protein